MRHRGRGGKKKRGQLGIKILNAAEKRKQFFLGDLCNRSTATIQWKLFRSPSSSSSFLSSSRHTCGGSRTVFWRGKRRWEGDGFGGSISSFPPPFLSILFRISKVEKAKGERGIFPSSLFRRGITKGEGWPACMGGKKGRRKKIPKQVFTEHFKLRLLNTKEEMKKRGGGGEPHFPVFFPLVFLDRGLTENLCPLSPSHFPPISKKSFER